MPSLKLSPSCLARLLQAGLAEQGTCSCRVEGNELIIEITDLRIWRFHVSVKLALSAGPDALARADRLAIRWRLVRLAGVPGFLVQRLLATIAGTLFRRQPFSIEPNRIVFKLAQFALAGRRLTDVLAVNQISVPHGQQALALSLKKAP